MDNILNSYKRMLIKKTLDKRTIHPSALKHLSVPDKVNLDVPLSNTVFIVFDTELTGLNLKKDSIVSIGALKMFGTRIDIGSAYYRVVAPESELTGKSVVVHGITPSEASVCPAIDILLPEFLDFCADGILVGHFVSIDLSFINKEMVRLYGFPLQNHSVDTQAVYMWIRNREEHACAFHAGIVEKLDLVTIAQKYSIQASDAHNALNDAFVTAQLFQRLIQSLGENGVYSIRDILGIAKQRKI